MDTTESKHSWGRWCRCQGGSSLWFGIFLILVGGFFIARDLGLIEISLPFWPTVALLFGIYFVVKSLKK